MMEKEENAHHKKGIEVAKSVLANGWDKFDPETMADYDATVSADDEPVLLTIWTKQPGQGLGYVVMHHFFAEKVGQGNTFLSTDFTDSGHVLFDKFKEQGLIKSEGLTKIMGYPHRYRAIADPMKNLENFVTQNTPQTENNPAAQDCIQTHHL